MGNIDNQLNALSQLTEEFLYSNQSQAKALALRQLSMSKSNSKLKWKADALGNLGTLYFTQGVIDSAEIYYQQAYNTLIGTDDELNVAVMRVNLSSAQRLNGRLDLAIANLQKSLDCFRQMNDDSRIAQVLSNIGTAHNEMGNLDKFFEYSRQALEIQERIGSKRPKGITLINLSLGMSAQRRFTEAVKGFSRTRRTFCPWFGVSSNSRSHVEFRR